MSMFSILFVFFLQLFSLQTWFLSANDYPYELSILAIFRDEAPYLKEWLEFHKLVGVEHFYLLNNCSEDDYLSVLQPYIDREEVELFEWPNQAHSWNEFIYEIQPQAYTMGIALASGQTKWLAIIDIDEFLTPINRTKVPEVLKDYESFGGVCFNWKIFGHSGFYDLPLDKLMVEALVMTAPLTRPTHLGVKSIVRPERVQASHHAHYATYKAGYFHVNSNKVNAINSDGVTNGVYYDRLVVNHYWSRSGSYLYKKLIRYHEWFPAINPKNWASYVEGMNVVKDSTMQPFIPPLREAMGL